MMQLYFLPISRNEAKIYAQHNTLQKRAATTENDTTEVFPGDN